MAIFTFLLQRNQDKDAEADALFKRAIEIGEKSLGSDHPDLAVWLHNRAWVLTRQVRTIVTFQKV